MESTFLRRYTDLPSVVQILTTKSISLLDPSGWEDRNDSQFLSYYRKKGSLRSLLAICFTQTGETFHHWKVFAGGPSGVCVEFDKPLLLQHLSGQKGLVYGPVSYKKMKDLQGVEWKIDQLPFIKQYAYRGEEEFRIIYTSKSTKMKVKNIPISIAAIRRIYLSPWLPSVLRESLAATIRSIVDCQRIEVVRSTIVDNKRWQYLGVTRVI